MILKKPYAFFIKMFKPIHLMLGGVVLYLIFLSNNVLRFLNSFMYSAGNVADEQVIESLISDAFYIIPISMIILFLLLLSIMYKKNKPVVFYFIGIFAFIVVLVINIYSINFLNILVEKIVSVKSIKLIHDLVLINILLESFCLMILFIRGVGIDFKRFDFNSDITQFEISESDKEEFEVSINIDFNERKRKRNEKIRNLKYLYIENKLIINVFVIGFLVLFVLEFIYFWIFYNKVNVENVYYSADSFDFKVNSTTILNTDFQGNKITEDYLVIVDTDIKSNQYDQRLYLNDFSLKIENYLFKPVKKYFDELVDLGNFYQEDVLSVEPSNYLFVFEIPEKYVSGDIYFRYNSGGNIIDILLNPKTLGEQESLTETKQITEELIFKEPLLGVSFKVNTQDLSDQFLINYNYCISKDDCLASKEYLKPSIDENYDKTILKLNVDYNEDNQLDIDSFYEFLSKFGMVSYRIDGKWVSTSKFEEITSKKVNLKNNVYIGLNNNILKADSIKLVFNIRSQRYEYILK